MSRDERVSKLFPIAWESLQERNIGPCCFPQFPLPRASSTSINHNPIHPHLHCCLVPPMPFFGHLVAKWKVSVKTCPQTIGGEGTSTADTLYSKLSSYTCRPATRRIGIAIASIAYHPRRRVSWRPSIPPESPPAHLIPSLHFSFTRSLHLSTCGADGSSGAKGRIGEGSLR